MIPIDEKAKEFAIMACSAFSNFPRDGSQFPYIGFLKEADTVESILRRFAGNTQRIGEEIGREEKATEIRKALNINDGS